MSLNILDRRVKMSERKRLLIYAHYYVPDKASTGQLLRELAEGLLADFDITVICAVPSYLGTIENRYKTKKYYYENINGVRVIRVRVPQFSKADKISRVKNIIAYFFGAIGASFKAGKQEYVFAISQPPILGGLLGVFGKLAKKAKYIYNIQDFNPEQTIAVNYSANKLVLNLMMALDKFSCRQSDLVITVGRDLADTLKNRFKKIPKYTVINNWADDKSIYPLSPNNEEVHKFREKYGLAGKFVIMYSGNIGLYYDLPGIMRVIEKFKPGTKAADGREAVFAFVGAGSMLEELMSYANKNGMDNVVFIPYQEKERLIYSLNSADVHWCVNAKGIKGVSCPSKYYGIAAAAKPVIAVLEKGTEIREIIEETDGGLCCEPGDYESIEKNIRWFLDNAGNDKASDMGRRGYEYMLKNLTRDVSIEKYRRALLEL